MQIVLAFSCGYGIIDISTGREADNKRGFDEIDEDWQQQNGVAHGFSDDIIQL